MNKWNRVPSICLRSRAGWRIRLRAPWLNPREVPQPAWVSEGRQKGRCMWKVSLEPSLNGPLKAPASIPHLPHLAPFTQHMSTLPTALPAHTAHGQSLLFPFLRKYLQDAQKMLVLPVSVCHLKGFAPANMDACMHMYLKFVFYFADACQTQSLSKC